MSATHILEEYLPKEAVAEQLGVSARTLERWDRLRIGPPRTKLGAAVFYRVDALKSWIRAQERDTESSRKKGGRA